MIQDAATELPKGMELVDLMSIKSFWDASVHNVIETLLEAQPAGYFHREALPARPAFHGDSRRGYCCIIDWNICFSLFCRNVRQHADAICAGTCYRYGGGRCDCCGRSYAVPLRQRLPSTRQATVEAMQGISRRLVTTSMVFMAVFIPVCFIGCATGQF